jgi:hypothetical protein
VVRVATHEGTGLRFESQHHAACGFSHEKSRDLWLVGPS